MTPNLDTNYSRSFLSRATDQVLTSFNRETPFGCAVCYPMINQQMDAQVLDLSGNIDADLPETRVRPWVIHNKEA